MNVSGGLISKGHPIGATGIANMFEVTTHLRGEAGDRQIEGAKVGLTHVIGLGSACARARAREGRRLSPTLTAPRSDVTVGTGRDRPEDLSLRLIRG